MTNNGGSTALHWACSVEHAGTSVGLIDLLISHGVNASAANRAGETPLHWAVDWLRPHAVAALLAHGALVNAPDADGNTPLHKIKRDCHEQEVCSGIVVVLTKAGADVSAKNNFQRTPLQHFNQDREQQTALAQQKRQADMQEQRQRAAAEDAARDGAGVSAAQVEQIQRELAEFQRNMTEGVLEEERHQLAAERERQEETEDESDADL